ncbi:hypothetical protein [Actinoplanes solisilvae]|uniref:hypothetical protein n=1 Tax=Actinoplanes solisilvae TaxID=2486853 RepID=UPI00196B200F|nr:hypothetical protein [Actinoplanes solisilvae]
MELRWWSIEVLDGPRGTARAWSDSLGNALTEAAVTHGAYRWERHTHTWGVLFEIAFRTDEAWEAFRGLPVVTAALDAVPDPAYGFFVYQGRGGSGGKTHPRRPHPIAGGGSAEVPIPDVREFILLGGSGAWEPDTTPAWVRQPS